MLGTRDHFVLRKYSGDMVLRRTRTLYSLTESSLSVKWSNECSARAAIFGGLPISAIERYGKIFGTRGQLSSCLGCCGGCKATTRPQKLIAAFPNQQQDLDLVKTPAYLILVDLQARQ